MNPSLVLPELLVRGNPNQLLLPLDYERTMNRSPLEHYRFCRLLLNQARHAIALPAFANALEAAQRSPYAKRYQPSIAALYILAHILGKPAESIHPQLFASKAPMGDRDGFYRSYRLLPFPIARELCKLWEEIGSMDQDALILDLAKKAREWLQSHAPNANYLFYRESEFDENEFADDRENTQTHDGENPCGCDDCLGMASFSTSLYQAALTLSGWNTGMGAMNFGDIEICAFGPQAFPLSDSSGFGLAQVPAQQPSVDVDSKRLSLQGWSRCYKDQEIWLYLNASADCQGIGLDVRWMGLKPTLSENIDTAPYAFAFYVKAARCVLEDGSVFNPKGLQRYQGLAQKLIFDQTMQIDCSQALHMQVIPLAGFDCFWNAAFLVAYEFNASHDQACFSVRLSI